MVCVQAKGEESFAFANIDRKLVHIFLGCQQILVIKRLVIIIRNDGSLYNMGVSCGQHIFAPELRY